MTHTKRMFRLVAGLLMLALCFSLFSASALAQPRRPVPPGRPFGPPPPPPPHRTSSLDRTLAIVGAAGAVATAVNTSRYGYRYPYAYPYPY